MKQQHQKRLEYLVQVQIVEVRDLKGKDKSGTCDPFIKITVGNLPPQVTQTRRAANTAVFNQSFTFVGLMMNTIEFEQFEIKIECFDLKDFGTNQLVGMYSVGISTLYRYPSHEIYNKWLALIHPKTGLEPQGFMLASAYVISPDDRPPVHDMNENNVEEEADPFGGVPDDQLDAVQLQQRLAKKQQIAIVGKPEVYGKSYQLMVNIVKGEDLQTMGYPTLDSFISVRAGGSTLITAVMKSQQKPQYLSRLMFPLHFPFFNDKIVLRIWDKRSCMSDTYMATIPEIPQENDFFSVDFLQSKGGVMPFRWQNVYGIPYSERPSNFQEMFLGYKKSVVGTDYLGRILVSLNLTQSEKPELMVVPLTTQREPQIAKYILRVQTYEVQDAKDCGEEIMVHFRVEGFVHKSPKAGVSIQKSKTDDEDKDTDGQIYKWGNKIIQNEDEVIELPQDTSQIPDMIISLYNQKNVRVAYIRIPYSSPDFQINRPKWYTFKSVKQSDNHDVPHSFFLVNILLRSQSVIAPLPKMIVKRNITENYLLRALLYAGYDLCPDCYSEETQVTFVLQIGKKRVELKQAQQGKNPIWNREFNLIVNMDQNLEFASNIIIKFSNIHPSKKGFFSNNHIGDVMMSALSCKYDDTNPRYEFHHIVKEGHSAGRILAAFQLIKLEKQDERNKTCREQQESAIFTSQQFETKFVQFPIFGVRNLKQRLKDPKLIVKVPIPYNPAEPQAKYYNQEECTLIEAQKNQLAEQTGWFGVSGILDPNFLKLVQLTVHLPQSLFHYPQLEIELFDAKNKSERYISSVPLVELNTWADVTTIQAAKDFFEAGKIFTEVDIKGGIKEDLKEHEAELLDQEKTSVKQSIKPSVKQSLISQPQEETKLKETIVPKETIFDKKSSVQQEPEKVSTVVSTQATDKSTVGGEDETIRQLLQTKGICNIQVQNMVRLTLKASDVEKKTRENKEKKKMLTDMLIEKKAQKYKNFESLKVYIKSLIERYQSLQISSDVYFREANQADESERYDYGREVLKGPYEDEIAKNIPFKKFALYRLSTTKYGIIGNPTDAVIKGDIRLSDHDSNSKVGSKKTTKRTTQRKTMKEQKQEDFSFNLFDQDFLDFFQEPFRLKVRVYILRCLNLAAQTSNIDANHMLAGMQAICSADSYPEIFIGDGNIEDTDKIKHITEQDRPILNTLSPNFFRMYELDAELPTDWKLILHIKNKGVFDSIIGSIQIDIEDRIVGEQKLKQRIAYSVNLKKFENELEELKYNDSVKGENRKNELKGHITNLGQRIENFDKKFKIPVEYKDLKIQGRNQASQGTVEMFVEVLPVDLAREIEPSPLNPPLPQDYEVRLIIWETFEIPKIPPKKKVDIMLAVSMDATATGTDKEIAKETDVHNGSENGDGSFNYRMKFPLVIPCPFPRMKLTVLDFSPFGTNESIGEATISLRPIIQRLRRDGKFEMPPTRIKLTHPNFPGQVRGEVLIQMDILTRPAADGQPVGDAQEEPNVNPYLPKPTEGRGLADFFKGAGFSMGNFMLYVKIFAGLFILIVGVMILFVKPGILVN